MSDMPPPPLLPRRRGGMRRAAADQGVIKTNEDAQSTKLSCASLGYFSDEMLPLLIKSIPSRKSPLMNRGTWARHAALRQITADFVTACVQQLGSEGCSISNSNNNSSSTSQRWSTKPICQVVSLGAGSDSSWFNLQHQGWPLLPAVHFIELDHSEVVSKKARTVLSSDTLLHLLPEGTTAHTAPINAPHAQSAAAAAAASTAAAATAAAMAAAANLPVHNPQSSGGPSAAQHAHTAGTWTKLQQPQRAAAVAAAAAAAALPQQQQQQQQQARQQGTSAAKGVSPQQSSAGPSSSITASVTAAAAAEGTGVAATTAGSSSSSRSGPAEAATHCAGPSPPAAVASHVQELTGPSYSLVGVDLRDMQQLQAALQRAGFDSRRATLYLCECVLIYLEPSEAESLLAAAASLAASGGSAAAVAIYEQTRPDDAFGATMISNLEARGCPLRSVMSVPTPSAQEQRLLSTGWTSAAAADMAAVYYGGSNASSNGPTRLPPHQPLGSPQASLPLPGTSLTGPGSAARAAAAAAVLPVLPQPPPCGTGCSSSGWLRPHWQSERKRIETLELLDELEEWKLLQEHYCLALGVLGDGPTAWLSEGLRLQQLASVDSR